MIIQATRKVEQSILSTTLTIDTFGTEDLTAEEEKAILEDYKIEIPYGKILFKQYIVLDENGSPTVLDTSSEDTDTSGADLVVLSMPLDESYEVTADMELTYAVDITKFNNETYFAGFQNIKDATTLGKAAILVYETTVVGYIKSQMDQNRASKDTFEDFLLYKV